MLQRFAHRTLSAILVGCVMTASPLHAQQKTWDQIGEVEPHEETTEEIIAKARERAAKIKNEILNLEMSNAWLDTKESSTHGPGVVKLSDQATLTLPANYIYVPAPQGTRVLKAYRTIPEADVIGIIASSAPNQTWMAALQFFKRGYIPDGEAATWNGEEQMKRLREENERTNEYRISKNEPPREILGWIEAPKYDAKRHTIQWSIINRPMNEIENGHNLVYYKMAALGREGYYRLVMNSLSGRVREDRVAAHTIMRNLAFNPGKRYEDYNPETDAKATISINRVAELAPPPDTSVTAMLTKVLRHWKGIVLGMLAIGLLSGGGIYLVLNHRAQKARELADA